MIDYKPRRAFALVSGLSTLVAMALAGSASALAQSASAQSVPEQGWATKSGFVDLQENGVKLAADSALARLQIQEVLARWGIAYDEGRIDVIRTLFTKNARFNVTNAEREHIADTVGIDAIIADVVSARKQQGDQRRHAITNVVVDSVTANRAKIVAYGIVTIAKEDLTLGATVIYTADLQRGHDGVWRFSAFNIGLDKYLGKPVISTSHPKP